MSKPKIPKTKGAAKFCMCEHDELGMLFRVWSDGLGAFVGLLIGLDQLAVGAPLRFVFLSFSVGIVAGEIAFHVSKRRALVVASDRRAAHFLLSIAISFTAGVGVVFFCHQVGIELNSGAIILVVLVMLFLEFFDGWASVGAMTGGVLGVLYWLIPPEDSFAILDRTGAVEFVATVGACLLTLAMARLLRKLNNKEAYHL